MLTDTVFPNEFTNGINNFLGIDSLGYPLKDTNGNPIVSQGDYPSLFATAYNDYALTGEVASALHGSEQPSILENWLRTFDWSLDDFAQTLANYWFTVLLIPGLPTHGGVEVVSVVNDATSHVSDFRSALLASLSLDGTIYRPVFIQFIDNVQTIALPTITWTITERFSDNHTEQFSEKIA